jgi:hypothetical protein
MGIARRLVQVGVVAVEYFSQTLGTALLLWLEEHALEIHWKSIPGSTNDKWRILN